MVTIAAKGNVSQPTKHGLSRRAIIRLTDVIDVSPKYAAISGKLYDKTLNPEGVINLSTAENSLLSEGLLDYMHAHFKLTSSHLKYRSTLEKSHIPNTADALPTFLNEALSPRIAITPKHTIPGPGLGALFAQCVWSICDEGDGVLLTTPYYSDYVRDIVYPGLARVVPAHVPADVDSLQPVVVKYMTAAMENSRKAGITVRAVVLCNPHNPLARSYPVETIIAYCVFAEKYDLQLIVDEVYANQVFASSFDPTPPPFISILSLDVQALAGCDPSRIHVIAGPTKDFGASGLKVGAFISQHNPRMVKLIRASLGAIPISSASDALFTPLLNDAEYLRWFLEENRKRLREAFELVGAWCQFHHLPFLPASAGVFVLIDFASIVRTFGGPDDSIERRVALTIDAMLANGVFVRPTLGEDPIETRFRLIFTQKKDIMQLAFHRLETAFGLPHFKQE